MGKIRVRTLGDEEFEKKQQKKADTRREAKALKKGKGHVEGVGLKGGQQVKIMEGVELKPEVEALLKADATSSAADGSVEPKEKKARVAKPRVRSKRYQDLASKYERMKLYPLKDALALTKKLSTTRFDATVEAHFNINKETLGKDKATLSGAVVLPHGTGKKRVVKIADEALIEAVGKGIIDFDVLVAHPSMMPKLAKVARVLGPKGLMPNPKNGTVTPTPEKRIKELEGGEVQWKTEADQPLIHQAVGKISFTEAQLEKNIKTLVNSIGISKMVKLTISSSMGPGIKVDITAF